MTTEIPMVETFNCTTGQAERRPATESEIEQMARDRESVTEYQNQMARLQRNALLSACDWTMLPDASLTAAQKAAWKKYRQELRDNPHGPWPDHPS